MWVCVCMDFVMCSCLDNCLGVLVICVLVFTVFCNALLCFGTVSFHVYLFLFFISVRTTATE